ncbi:ABC transporter permease [Alkanindiges illinoisensis]|nr:ABC transporter permease [Alkanindiges illinoisensis]
MNTKTNSHNTSLRQSLGIQKRVVFALLMREIITRFGRHNIGFLWLFAEPMIFTLAITAAWTATKGVHGSELPIIPFAVTGYSTVLLWRNVANRCGKAVEANGALLFHRNVKIIDLMLSRIILEIGGATISFVVISVAFIALGLMELPDNIFLMLMAWLLTAWFATGLGFIVGVISEVSELFDRLWHAFTYILFGLSGVGFLVDWLPTGMQKVVLYIPMVHGTEMLRHGYFGDSIVTYEDPVFLILINISFTFFGLLAIKRLSKTVTPE